MADYYAIILSLTSFYFESAAMELVSSGPGSATFTVHAYFRPGSSASGNFNSDRYLSSTSTSLSNLFAPSARTTAMVRGASSVAKAAFLRQWSGTHNIGYVVPEVTTVEGTSFYLPNSATVSTAMLLIGNRGSSSTMVRLYYGSSRSASWAQYVSEKSFAIATLSNEKKNRARHFCRRRIRSARRRDELEARDQLRIPRPVMSACPCPVAGARYPGSLRIGIDNRCACLRHVRSSSNPGWTPDPGVHDVLGVPSGG